MTTLTLDHRCPRTHRTTSFYLPCAFGPDLTGFRGVGPYVVLHFVRVGYERFDRVHAEAFPELAEASDRLAGITAMHREQEKCSGTCTGNGATGDHGDHRVRCAA
jgi:hypothetical protein